MLNVGGILGGDKVSLEKAAFDIFSAQVEAFNGGNGSSYRMRRPESETHGRPNVPDQFTGVWGAQDYAGLLVDYAPKHRFMFKIEFVFNPTYMTGDSKAIQTFTYMIKQIDRPTVSFDYEPVNMYNFKTKVLKGIEHRPLNMQFYDDIQNNVLNFFNAYRKAYSPISRIWPELNGKNTKYFQEHGLDFSDPKSDPASGGDYYTASVGVLANEQYNVLDMVRIHQVFAHGSQVNTFSFINPRILEFDFDDIDHEGGNGNMMSVQFEYDALAVTTFSPTSMGGTLPMSPVPDILGHGEAAQYPRRPGPPGPTFDKPNPFVDQMVKGATGIAQAATSHAVSTGVTGVLGQNAGGLGYQLGTIVGGQTRNGMGSTLGTVNQSFAKPSTSAVSDSASTPEEAAANTKVTSSNGPTI